MLSQNLPPLKIQIVSDLHLDINKKFNSSSILNDESKDILILAGDICGHLSFQRNIDLLRTALDVWSNHFKYIVYVFGNHEYYDGNIDDFNQYKNNIEQGYTNVHILEQNHLIIDNICIIGTTMWSNFDNFSPVIMNACQRRMNDFHIVKYKNRLFTPNDAANIYQHSIDYIKHILKNNAENIIRSVVVTHHAPSFMSVSERYKGDS